ncbi:hypothetical protein [Providencia phage PSTCR2]|uniref:Internal virion protein A n=1 Tax=Providencia phage PSTCR2 TaxID=2783544 RepID=A0A873WH53_9CAUD|nr:hypothetical protein [Providencia phage PSTCR2]
MFIRETIDNDLEQLSKSITEGDLQELRVFNTEMTVIEALKLSVKSCECYTISDEFGLVYAVGGTNSVGVAWFVTSTNIELLTRSEVREFINLLKEHRDECLKVLPYLTNYISVYNTKHIKLLKLLGATFDVTEFSDILTFIIKRGDRCAG